MAGAPDRHTVEEQPFMRCPACERDWGRFDTRCGQCGEALDTDKARAFNAALWSKRLEERKQEQAAADERAAAAARQGRELSDTQKQMGIEMARDVKQRHQLENAVEAARGDGPFGWRHRFMAPVPFFVAAAYQTHGVARWALGGVAAVLGGISLWFWVRSSMSD
jgi:hypothetical protein